MSQPVARVGDTGVGICYAHPTPTPFTTTFTEGNITALIDDKGVITIGAIGVTTCGHHTIAMTGSSTVEGDNSNGVHRVGDVGIVLEDNRGTYVCVSGSDDTTGGD